MADRPSVRLTAPDGSGETTVHTTTAFNNLVFGQGYAPEDGNVTEAYARLLEETTGDDPTPMVSPE